MPWYPLPALIALAGWMFVFMTSKWLVAAYGVGSLLVGVFAFLAWDALSARRSLLEDPLDDGSLASRSGSE